MPTTTINQECHLIKTSGDTYFLRIKLRNVPKVKQFINKKLDVEITLSTKED